jgi:anaerobic ribonucleoside-triphosphate reductase activating protein
MRYAGITYNDVLAAPGISVSVFLQGCPFHCEGCHNPETWDPEGGKEFTAETLDAILSAISANGIKRNLCLMGGEPLAPENRFTSELIIQEARKKYPDLKIFVWTGYLFEDLKNSIDPKIKYILDNVDCIIDGPYVKELRDITLAMRGSSNQRIIYLKN